MRMRRTAFIMALMTVFTVSLFAQNSRGRNYIKQNISEWGGCRNVAITDTGGDLALNGKNDYAYTAGIPQALADALEKYHDDDDYIDDVQLTEDGEWLILVGKNGCQWSNIPSELESKLRQWNEAEETITSVTFNRVGGKRSSFSPTFVFRPLTPPYVRFRIRRFLFWVPFDV